MPPAKCKPSVFGQKLFHMYKAQEKRGEQVFGLEEQRTPRQEAAMLPPAALLGPRTPQSRPHTFRGGDQTPPRARPRSASSFFFFSSTDLGTSSQRQPQGCLLRHRRAGGSAGVGVPHGRGGWKKRHFVVTWLWGGRPAPGCPR